MKALRAFLVRLTGVFSGARRDRNVAEQLGIHI